MRWCLVVFVIGCAHAPAEPLQNPMPRRSPQEPKVVGQNPPRGELSPIAAALADIDMFAIVGVGFTGQPSRGELLALQLAREPDAIVMFERLATRENRAARLYAYWALRTLDPARAQLVRPQLASDQTEVDVMGGCILTSRPTHEVFHHLETKPGPELSDRQHMHGQDDPRYRQVPAASRASVR